MEYVFGVGPFTDIVIFKAKNLEVVQLFDDLVEIDHCLSGVASLIWEFFALNNVSSRLT